MIKLDSAQESYRIAKSISIVLKEDYLDNIAVKIMETAKEGLFCLDVQSPKHERDKIGITSEEIRQFLEPLGYTVVIGESSIHIMWDNVEE